MSSIISAHGHRVKVTLGQRGAATLAVVMILFFVMSMVAAYSNRNLIFEQRTSANQLRSTRALEAAEAGVEWALTMLNTGRITDACVASTLASDTSFRQRYLDFDSSGNINPKKRSDGITELFSTCVYGGASWTCSCPVDSAPVVVAPAGPDIYPAFLVRFRKACGDSACFLATQPGLVHIDVNGCTVATDDCLKMTAGFAATNESRATVHVSAALRNGLAAAPIAAVTTRTGLNFGAASLGVSNDEVSGSGTTILSGGPVVATGARVIGAPGTPAQKTIIESDAGLAALTADRMFANTFGMWRSTFREQPSAVVLTCAPDCKAATLRAKILLNPGRVFWLNGDLDLDTAGDIGSLNEPVILNVTGQVTFSSAATIYGVVYSQAPVWTLSGAGSVVGAVVAEGSLNGTATTDIVYKKPVLTLLQTRNGSFVRVPGSWRDFE